MRGLLPLNTQKPSRELSVEEILSWTFDLYSKNIGMFLIPIMITALVSGSLSIPIASYATKIAEIDRTAPPEVVLSQLWSYILTLLAMTIVISIITWIVSNIANGVCVKCASDLIEKGKASLGESFNFALNKLLVLLVATLITGILVVLGFLALIVPGIILYIMFYLVVPAIIIENIGVFESLSRSRRLVSGRWLKTFVLSLILIIIIGFVSFIGSLIGAPLGVYSLFLSSIIAAFVQPIIPISLTVYYYSMLAKEEQRILPPPPPPF